MTPIGERHKTIRQSMIELLKEQSLSARDLSQMLSVTEKEAVSHLYHVQKSVSPEFALVVEAAACQHCGYTFETRKRLSKPSKCPQCKHQHITAPSYRLVGLDSS